MATAIITNVEDKGEVTVITYDDSKGAKNCHGIYDTKEVQSIQKVRGDLVGEEVLLYDTANPLKPHIVFQ